MARRDERRSGGGGRLLALTLLAAAVAAVMAYLGNCVPGFGIGGSSSPSSSSPATTPRTEGEPASTADTLHLKVDGDRCRRGSEAPDSCPAVCESLATEHENRKILVDGTLGTHAAVDALRRCLTEHGFRDVVVRTE